MATTRRKLYLGLGGAIVLALVIGISAGPIMSRVEQPSYTVSAGESGIEVRAYAPMIAAQATVSGTREVAIREGFRLIAAYIFGANKPNAKIAMTAPVQQQAAQPALQKIEMTAPVTQQATADVEANRWTVRFIMPTSWTLETLPAPNDARVTLLPLPAKRMAVIRFSGSVNDALIAAKTAQLRAFVDRGKFATVGAPVLAFYNPPWTLPFFRRNEIMLELAETARTG